MSNSSSPFTPDEPSVILDLERGILSGIGLGLAAWGSSASALTCLRDLISHFLRVCRSAFGHFCAVSCRNHEVSEEASLQIPACIRVYRIRSRDHRYLHPLEMGTDDLNRQQKLPRWTSGI
jgi:hypothetical protein